MNAVVNAQPEQRTPEWFAQRRGRITASRVGAILGLSRYRTPEDVMRDMVREWHGAPREFAGNEATHYGEAHEGDAIDAYEQRFGALVMPSPLVVHPAHDWLAASPDGLVGEDGLIECKAPFRAQYTHPSDEYQAQMQLQLACTGREWCDFCVWREGETIHVTRAARDPMWIESNMLALRTFIERFRDTVNSDKLSAPYLADKERRDAEWREWADMARMAAQRKAAAEQDYKDAVAKLAELAPDGAKGAGITLSRVERQGTIAYAQALKALLPDADLEPYRGKPSTTYALRVTA